MMAPGLIAIAFYRRWPSRLQITLGAVATVAGCVVLGWVLPAGALGRAGSVTLAVVGGLLLYGAILMFLYVRHQRSERTPPSAPSSR
jgi:hypothetical protein